MRVYRCRSAFVHYEKGGARRRYQPGQLVAEGDPILAGREKNFELVDDFMDRTQQPVEQATAAPGEKRAVRPAAAEPTRAKPESAPQRPPASGPGSGVEAWRQYAAEVTGSPAGSWATLTRDEIIELLESEGVGHGSE